MGSTIVYVVVVDAKFEAMVVIVLPVVVMLHSSMKSAIVPGTVQLNLAIMMSCDIEQRHYIMSEHACVNA